MIYQLVWQRALFRIFGVNIESVTIVVTAFMLGLGLGGLVGGWLSNRHRIPLLPLLATIELLTGAFGGFSLSIFDHFGALVLGRPLAFAAAAALALVLVPTLLMGATLPLLVGHFTRQSGSVGESLGFLYYVNTLGAGAACLIATVLLFPFLGMQNSVYVGVALNASVAVGALTAHFCRSTRGFADAPEGRPARAHLLNLGTALALAFFGGLVSLSYEIFFFRIISYATGSSAPAFAVTLGAFLVGLAGGSREASRVCATAPEQATSRLLRDLMVATLIGYLFLPILSHVAWLGNAVLGVDLLLVYLFARYWAGLLPCIADFSVPADRRAGMRTGIIYLANILGSASGAIVTGFVLMDRLSHIGIALALTAMALGCALTLMVVLTIPGRAKLARAGGVLTVVGLTALLLPWVRQICLRSCYGGAGRRPTPHLPGSSRIVAGSLLWIDLAQYSATAPTTAGSMLIS